MYTNEYYIGIHSTNNLDDGYLGSGDIIRRKIKKYHKSSFVREILHFCETRELAFQKEKDMVCETTLNDPLCINISIGGIGNINPNPHNSPESNLKRSLTQTGQIRLDRRGIPISEEHKQKIKTKLKGRVPHNKGQNTPEHIKIKMKGRIPHNKGKHHNDLTIAKIKNSPHHTKCQKQVSVDDVIYESVSAVMKQYNFHRSTVMCRLKSKSYPSWFYVIDQL